MLNWRLIVNDELQVVVVYPSIYLEQLKKTKQRLGQEVWPRDRNSNPGCQEYETGV
jgi:hypothetical protein